MNDFFLACFFGSALYSCFAYALEPYLSFWDPCVTFLIEEERELILSFFSSCYWDCWVWCVGYFLLCAFFWELSDYSVWWE